MRSLARFGLIPALLAALVAPALAATGPLPGWSTPVELTAGWAGYVATSPDLSHPLAFTSATGTWRQPSATCESASYDSSAAFWVGLGGFFDGAQQMEMVGTAADCSQQGPPSYYAWYAATMGDSHTLAMTVEPGDVLTATVSVTSSNLVTLQIRNVTRHKLAVLRERVAAVDLSSAEWVAESPGNCQNACEPLANFGTVGMSKIRLTAAGHTGTLADPTWLATPLQIKSSGKQQFYAGPAEGTVTDDSLAGTCAPTAVASDGGSFQLRWVDTVTDC